MYIKYKLYICVVIDPVGHEKHRSNTKPPIALGTKHFIMTIFSYNTRTSFGLGSEHLSVKLTDDSKIEFYTGTPMEPVLSKKIEYDPSIIDEIKDKTTYLNEPEIAMFIKLEYIN